MDVVKVRCLGSKKIEQFRYILTVGGKEWFIYSLIKVMKAVLMFLNSSVSAQLLAFFFHVPLGCEQQTKMIATWVVTAIHCLVAQSSSERCVTWRQNELFTRTLCHPIFFMNATLRWNQFLFNGRVLSKIVHRILFCLAQHLFSRQFILMVWGTNVAEEELLTAISFFLCCALRDSRLETRQTAASTVVIFVVAHSYLCGPESILLTNLLYLVHELFLFEEVLFSFLLTKMFYFFIRRLWNSPGTTKWYEQVINFYCIWR